MIDFVKATLISGEPILLNEFKIESVWVEKSKDGKEVCFLVLDSGSKIQIKPALFYSWVNKKKVVK